VEGIGQCLLKIYPVIRVEGLKKTTMNPTEDRLASNQVT